MERFVIRNYGPSRNLPDGRGSYIFLEREGVQGTSDPEMAKLFATYPDVVVSERGEALAGPPVSAPPMGPSPPDEPDEPEDGNGEDNGDQGEDKDQQGEDDSDQGETKEVEPIDYESLLVADLRAIAKERSIPTDGLLKADLIKTLQQDDEK